MPHKQLFQQYTKYVRRLLSSYVQEQIWNASQLSAAFTGSALEHQRFCVGDMAKEAGTFEP